MNMRILLTALGFTVTLASHASDQEQSYHEKMIAGLKEQTAVKYEYFPDMHPKRTAYNDEAPIPPQCYTDTAGRFNPCYVCHQNQIRGRENAMNDGSLQVAYAFSDVGMTNHWKNLFEDRSKAVVAISDEEIIDYVSTDNYSALAPRLRAAGFKGWIPDLENLHLAADAFDEYGFAKDGSHWVAFNYKPLPSTFWPTNGSTDDVMIRLDTPFRTDAQGNYSIDIYRANLAILEATVKAFDRISSLPVNEARVGRDLNGDGELTLIEELKAPWRWVGAAQDEAIEPSLYPKGTEFLHTVRYVGTNEEGDIFVPQRMKEVRYIKKWNAYDRGLYDRVYTLEGFAKEAGQVPDYLLLGDHGLDNGFGWSVLGFIEDSRGELRTLQYEENLFCMGCHSSIGATIDKTFSFPRKVDGAAGWGYINLRGMPDAPNLGEKEGEFATYLRRVGGGGEFRSNTEMYERWFTNGKADLRKIRAARDVYELIAPSRERAIELNKAYRVIVRDQDYIYGRDATVTPPENVLRFIDNATAPTLPADLFFPWDIRLDWSAVPSGQTGSPPLRSTKQRID